MLPQFGSPLPILIVEDNLINQKVLLKMLERLGVKKRDGQVDVANDGVEALEFAARRTYPLILMDMSMPRMDGVEASKQLRARGYAGRIVGVSANAMDEHREACLQNGMDEFLVKPIQMEQLRRVLQSTNANPESSNMSLTSSASHSDEK